MVDKNAVILDDGCGYGRLSELFATGFTQITGADTCSAFVGRGLALHPELNLLTIQNSSSLPFKDHSFDLILLFAVLTCIPANSAQLELIRQLHDQLRPGGVLYISDYYLQ